LISNISLGQKDGLKIINGVVFFSDEVIEEKTSFMKIIHKCTEVIRPLNMLLKRELMMEFGNLAW